ncbi:LPP20 family lipoprotein [Shewanella avicenniae]|uniref:LPP20 family lipoprotein n=1 Tax=Shewanella avicenniae TaxID=2814294 RepID=A0ABX7QMT0_9GAMM|nr:LPP20 family lipoprotein [Shewanella avicenniae]QSX32746.1 LPP20 family lipoprotein [Shewanella avicenniae]
MMRVILVAAIVLLAGCSSMREKYVQYETVAPEQFPTLTATGYAPLASQPGKTQAERVLMAMQASKIAAYRELAEQVYGQHLQGSSSVGDWAMKSDTVKASVSGVIRGAKVIASYPAGEHYVTELELDFATVWQLYQQQNRPQEIRSVTYF